MDGEPDSEREGDLHEDGEDGAGVLACGVMEVEPPQPIKTSDAKPTTVMPSKGFIVIS